MSDVSQGPGWWLASDGRWYPPETHPQYRAEHVQTPATIGGSASGGSETPGIHVVEQSGAHAAGPGGLHVAEPAGPQVAEPEDFHVAELSGLHVTEPFGPVPEPVGQAAEWQGTTPAGPEAGGETKWMPTYVAPCHHRVVGPGLVVLGLAVLVWGVGQIFNAVAAVNAGFPHNEQIGAWLTAAGILAGGLVLAIVGLLYRRG